VNSSATQHAPPAARRKGLSLAQKDALIGYLFILPRVIGFLIFVLGPLLAIFYFSLQSRNLLSRSVEFIGLENYRVMFTEDSNFWPMVQNTLTFTAGLVPLNLVLALSLAILLAPQFKGVTFFRTVFFAPVITSTAAWIIVWAFILQGQQGPLNQFLAAIGIEGPNWLREPGSAMFAVIITRVIKNVGLNMVIFLAALQDLPREYVEAARVDGARGWQVVRYIILPFLAPSILLVTVITVIGSLNVFDHILLLTNGGPSNATMVLAFYVYFNAFKAYEIGYASAIAVLLFLAALVLTVVQWALRRRMVYLEQ
jgi:multiple sugar transport system permease protein